MTKTDFTIMLDEVLNEFDCKIDGILYTDDNIAIVNYSPVDVNVWRMYIAYRYLNNGCKSRKEYEYLVNTLIDNN